MNEFNTPAAEGQPGPEVGATPPGGAGSGPPQMEGLGAASPPDDARSSTVLGGTVAVAPSFGRDAGASHTGSRQDIDGALGELPSLLARSATGLEFIYQSLELVAARYGLRDLVVVVDRPDRHQIFRLGRRPSSSAREPLPSYLTAAFAGRPGLYAEPPVVGPLAAACLTSLVELALRLDLLTHDASHDALTGLLNRRSYELLLDQAVSRARRYGWPFALVVLDLDDFKVVNDRYGHAAGDAALRAVGTELRAALRGGDVAARLGGDEFAAASGGRGERGLALTAPRPSEASSGAGCPRDDRGFLGRGRLLPIRYRRPRRFDRARRRAPLCGQGHHWMRSRR